MEGRPHGSLTASDGYGSANSASYPAHTDSGHGRQGQQRLAHTADTDGRVNSALNTASTDSYDGGEASWFSQIWRRLRQAHQRLIPSKHGRRRRRQGQQRLAYTADTDGRVSSALNTASTDSYDGGGASWVSYI